MAPKNEHERLLRTVWDIIPNSSLPGLGDLSLHKFRDVDDNSFIVFFLIDSQRGEFYHRMRTFDGPNFMHRRIYSITNQKYFYCS